MIEVSDLVSPIHLDILQQESHNKATIKGGA